MRSKNSDRRLTFAESPFRSCPTRTIACVETIMGSPAGLECRSARFAVCFAVNHESRWGDHYPTAINLRALVRFFVAERVGFEPTELIVRLFSRQLPSTARPPLQQCSA